LLFFFTTLVLQLFIFFALQAEFREVDPFLIDQLLQENHTVNQVAIILSRISVTSVRAKSQEKSLFT